MSDLLLNVIAGSCYGHEPKAFVNLLRSVIRSFHSQDPTVSQAVDILSHNLVECVPIARMNADNNFGLYDSYSVKLNHQKRPLNFVWKGIMAQGSYNDVYKAMIQVRCDKPSCHKDHDQQAVIKITSQAPKDLRVYLMENVIHAILNELTDSAPFVVHMFCPFKLRQNTHPPFKLGCVLEDPGLGDLAAFICGSATDREMFSLTTQIGLMLVCMQGALRFQHRDLKADNLVIVNNPSTDLTVTLPANDTIFSFPSCGVGCKMIDFGMTRLEIGGEYVGCDIYHNSTEFNPCHDVQFFVATTLEDFEGPLGTRCPIYLDWLKTYGRPITEAIRVRRTSQKAVSQKHMDYFLGEVTEKENIELYRPEEMLKSLAGCWARLADSRVSHTSHPKRNKTVHK